LDYTFLKVVGFEKRKNAEFYCMYCKAVKLYFCFVFTGCATVPSRFPYLMMQIWDNIFELRYPHQKFRAKMGFWRFHFYKKKVFLLCNLYFFVKLFVVYSVIWRIKCKASKYL